MKTVYSVSASPSVIESWIEKIMESFSCACEFAKEDMREAHEKYRTGFYQSIFLEEDRVVWLDNWNAEVSLKEGDNFIELIGITTGGNIQLIRLQEDGRVTVTHDGRRGSTLGRIWDFVRGAMEESNWPKEWVLEEYHSSQESWWPVSCWLPTPPWEERLRPVARWEADEKGWLEDEEEIFFEKGVSGRQIVW